jgi:ketopantoate hydroxymethyltransferase
MTTKKRIMITVGDSLADYLREKSKELNITMSGVIMVALSRMREQEKAQTLLADLQIKGLMELLEKSNKEQ